MKQALQEAQKAFDLNEVPVGCVIVKDNEIIAKAYNKRETTQNTIAHAEILAIQEVCNKLNSWRLDECSIYVTLEPCSMCSGAIIQARIKNLFFGAFDQKTGAAGSVYNLFDIKFNHTVNVTSSILKEECENILKKFFVELRSRKKY